MSTITDFFGDNQNDSNECDYCGKTLTAEDTHFSEGGICQECEEYEEKRKEAPKTIEGFSKEQPFGEIIENGLRYTITGAKKIERPADMYQEESGWVYTARLM